MKVSVLVPLPLRVAGRAAGVERQLRRAGDHHGLAPADGDGDDRADAVGAVGGR